MLIVRDLVGGPRRFVELQRTLPGISTEQLRSRLNRMVADGLLTRQRYREVPPRVDYELTERARDLLPVIGALARWGYQWAWGSPRQGEAVDVGAILRCLPGLSVPAGLKGSVALTVRRNGADDRDYVVSTTRDELSVVEGTGEGTSAHIDGTEAAWIAALGPDPDRSGLKIDGDQRVASALLDGVAPVALTEAAVA